MADSNTTILLRDIIAADKHSVDICLNEDIVVICVQKDTQKTKRISFKVMYGNNSQFWLQNEIWEYFVSSEDDSRIKNLLLGTEAGRPAAAGIGNLVIAKTATPEVEQGFGTDYEVISAMSPPERVQHIHDDIKRLEDLFVQKPRQEELVTKALVETARDTVLHNHAAIQEAKLLSDDEAKRQTQEMVDSTFNLVKASSRLISENIFNDELMNTLVAKSNGTIIQHMTRVHLNGLAFLYYYNKIVSGSSLINKMRITFKKDYRPYYLHFFPDIDPETITLEKVFRGGMRAIPETDFCNWAVGFLIHDIGKASAVEYHEGEAAYDRDIVVEHVKVGYTSVVNKTNYPKDAALITGYHHEYYGDPAGYGYFRSYLEQYKKENPSARQHFCITFEMAPLIDCEALSFFPAKVLEIIDVYDSVTDPNRKYRKPLSTEEALTMMREEFIIKHHKFDLILFDIFSKFARESLPHKN